MPPVSGAAREVAMPISREEVAHIALLARVGMTEEDLERFQGQLSDILEQFQILQQVDTTDVPPTAQSIDLENVMAPDQARPSWPGEDILLNAPDKEEGHFKIRP